MLVCWDMMLLAQSATSLHALQEGCRFSCGRGAAPVIGQVLYVDALDLAGSALFAHVCFATVCLPNA